MLNWFLKFIPEQYKWDVAAKKVAYTTGKVLVALILGSKAGPAIQAHTSGDQIIAVQTGVSAACGMVLELVHDYLKMKFPDNGWL